MALIHSLSKRLLLTFPAGWLLKFFLSTSVFAGSPAPPEHPEFKYSHEVMVEAEFGSGAGRFWIFEPSAPRPQNAPLIIFLHGYGVPSPFAYKEWIRHIVKQGNIVIYPQYQANLFTPPSDYHLNTANAVRSALKVLEESGHVHPDPSRVAVVGHSAGGVGAATFAARALEDKLPVPKAVMSVHPGQGLKNGWQLIPLDDYSKISSQTHLLIVVGTEDQVVGIKSAQRIWNLTGQISDRGFLTIRGDDHGVPPLRSNHLAPFAYSRESTDAIDWFGYWRTFDQLTPDMGSWSDGQPVQPINIQR